ncbi:hypothetical protein [Natrialba sp. INN-245]|nr:hypothetical protein [Natrialba sp. INN-245]
MDVVPAHLEVAIYLYFLVVATAGFLLYARVWFGRHDGDSAASSTN